MKRSLSLIGGVLAGSLLLAASSAHAHVKMLKPAPWLNEGDGLVGIGAGDPQKGGPCGPGGSDDVQPIPKNGTITTFKAGETISVEWTETIQHPGYYRIALAENRADLKDPTVPFTNMSQCNVDHSKVPTGAHDNVLADGVMLTDDATSRPGFPDLKHQVTLPNKPCEKCTLQLIQFMEAHGQPCIYYHCADIKIVAAGADAGVSDAGVASDAGGTGTKVDASTSVIDSGSTTGTVGGTTSGTGAATPGGTASGTGAATLGGTTSGTTPPAGGSTTGGTAATPGTAGGTGTITGPATAGGTAPGGDDEGCSVSLGGGRSSLSGLVSMLLVLGALARRRKQQR